jgi:hypothetical protein
VRNLIALSYDGINWSDYGKTFFFKKRFIFIYDGWKNLLTEVREW